MPFTIRIELHNANATHYADLAKKLAAIGITDTIRGDDGVTYKLPPAEYNNEASIDINTVQRACAGIASSVVPGHAIFVTQCGPRLWSGLQVAK